MNDFKIHFTDGSTLVHYGKKRRSGRYPWGSGERPYQSDPKATQALKDAESGFKTWQKRATGVEGIGAFDIMKMQHNHDVDEIRRAVEGANERGWASKEFMTLFRTWDFVNHYYDNEFDYFPLPDEIKNDINKALEVIEKKYYYKDGPYKGEYKWSFDKKLNINIPDAHWRLLREKDPNLDKNQTPPSMREENKWMNDFDENMPTDEILAKSKNYRLIAELLWQDAW